MHDLVTSDCEQSESNAASSTTNQTADEDEVSVTKMLLAARKQILQLCIGKAVSISVHAVGNPPVSQTHAAQISGIQPRHSLQASPKREE